MKKVLFICSVLLLTIGIGAFLAGVLGSIFTYKNVTAENIITTPDASIPNKKVQGPLTLKAQADVIKKHMLKANEGKTYAQLPRLVEKRDENNQPVLDEQGNPIMIANEDRNTWVVALTLISSLNLGIAAYMVSGLAALLGIVSFSNGLVMYFLYRKELVKN